ncbi:hypothetical protein ES703_124973 [subsurface metagenome]
MLGWLDGYGRVNRVNSGKIYTNFSDSRQSFFNFFFSYMPQIEVNILVIKTVFLIDLCLDSSGDDISGGKFHG